MSDTCCVCEYVGTDCVTSDNPTAILHCYTWFYCFSTSHSCADWVQFCCWACVITCSD